MADSIKGYPSTANEEREGSEQANVVPVSPYTYALGVFAVSYAYEVATDAVEAGSTAQAITASSHSAIVGDVVLFTSGNLSGQAVNVTSVSVNLITLAQSLSEAPAVSDTFSIRRFIPAKVDSDGIVQTSGSGGGGGSVTEYTEGDVDASITGIAQLAEAAGDTLEPLQLNASNELKVEISSAVVGLATSALQTTGNASLTTIAGDTTSLDGKVTACDTGSVTVSSSALPSGAATSANQTTGNSSLSTIAGDTTSLDGKVTACNTGAVVVSSSALPSGAATSANQLPDGHNVTIDNAAGASAVNIQDGGNSITVDGTITATPSGTQDVDVVANSVGLATSSNQLPDGHNVTIDNSSGGGAVNIQDGGNSITVDGTVASTQSGTWNVTNVSGTVSLPTGASTEATLSSVLTELQGKADLGETQPVSATSLPLPSGAATSALQTTGNSSLSTIAGDTTSLDGKVATCDTDDVRQATHDNFNANANIQIGNSDVSDSNAVPTSVRRSSSTTLVSAVTFNNTTTSDTSSSVDCGDYRDGILYYDLSKANTPGALQMTIQGSFDDSSWFNIGDTFLNQLLFDDGAVGTGLDEYVRVSQIPPYVRLKTDATSTSASNTFTLTATWTMTD